MSDYSYAGAELDLFAAAKTWKAYWASEIRPFLRGRVLEVGAGIGTNTRLLCEPGLHQWTSLEPDAALAARLQQTIVDGALQDTCRVVIGTVRDLPPVPNFDSILYLDVLEHIADDREELSRAAALLGPGGHLVVLAPAHQALYSAFDQAVGHYRRYSRSVLLSLTPPALATRRAVYLDAAGLAASVANRILLRQAMPTAGQIRAWDGWMVPASRLVDGLLGYALGKSVCVIWVKASA